MAERRSTVTTLRALSRCCLGSRAITLYQPHLLVLDLSPIIEGGNAAVMFRNTADLAQLAQRWATIVLAGGPSQSSRHRKRCHEMQSYFARDPTGAGDSRCWPERAALSSRLERFQRSPRGPSLGLPFALVLAFRARLSRGRAPSLPARFLNQFLQRLRHRFRFLCRPKLGDEKLNCGRDRFSVRRQPFLRLLSRNTKTGGKLDVSILPVTSRAMRA